MKDFTIYIKELYLQNIRTFGQNVDVSFEKKDTTIPNWTLILGDNGIGKSTLLQCIAWIKPYFPYEDSNVRPSAMITDEENETLLRLVRKGANKAVLKATFVADKKLNEPDGKTVKPICVSDTEIGLDKEKLDKVDSSIKTVPQKSPFFYKSDIRIFGYSASRQLGKLNLNNPKLLDTIPGFISEQTELYDAEEILHYLNYAALGAKPKEKRQYTILIERIKKMLVTILPDFEDVKSIEILAPNIFENDRNSSVVVTSRHGKRIPFSNFSLGYKTVTSWAIDLAWRLFNLDKQNPNPLDQPAIVLIDEVDLHLHPVWQREIMDNLSAHFPNVQFIATAHSPLMVQAAIESNYIVLKYNDEGVLVENNLERIDGWRIDQILTSEFFGLQSARGLKYDQLLDRRQELMRKKRLNAAEKKELQDIENKLTKLPAGETPKEIENRKFISEVVEKIKETKVRIKI